MSKCRASSVTDLSGGGRRAGGDGQPTLPALTEVHLRVAARLMGQSAEWIAERHATMTANAIAADEAAFFLYACAAELVGATTPPTLQ